MIFNCKQFSIRQSDDVFKITSDTTLLGAWASLVNPNQILEVGSGTGMISLMLAQRYREAQICAIDVNPMAVQLSNYNFQKSPWPNRMEAHHLSLQKLALTSHCTFDEIITNPPYHNSTTLPSIPSQATARHDASLPFEKLIFSCSQLLTQNGRLHLIIPSDRVSEFLGIAASSNLYPSSWCDMHPRKESRAKRTMLALTKEGALKAPSQIIIMYDKNHKHHDDYRKLLTPFQTIF